MTQLTTTAIESAVALEAVDDFVELLEITFPGEEVFRFTNQAVEILKDADGFDQEDDYGNPIPGVMHKGQPYYYLSFSLPSPEQEGGKAPETSITVDNTDKRLMPYIQQFTGQADVVLKLIHTSDPDVVQKTVKGLKLLSADGNEDEIEGKLGMDYLTEQAYPKHTYTPDWCPGMF